MSGFKKIKQAGEDFIITLANKESSSNSWLEGNNGKFPFSVNVSDTKWWKSNCKDRSGNSIYNNSKLAEALIDYYNYYCEIYELDANILAAQAYQEGRFKVWIYNNSVSSASGTVQFLMIAIYDIIVLNNYSPTPKFTTDEINRIIHNITDPYEKSSYQPGDSNYVARLNREQLHQNFIDNLDIMIKAQCRYMKYCSNRADGIAASALFGYNRGPAYIKSTYTDTVNNYSGNNIKEGLEYVRYIFGYLGDKNNLIIPSMGKFKNIEGLSFGYDEKLELHLKYFAENSLSIEGNSNAKKMED